MATAGSKTTSTTELPDLAQKMREQVLSSIQQGQQVSLDVTKSWANAVSALPGADLPKLPGVQDVDAATKYGFDFAADLLNAQRSYALQLTDMLAPKSA